MFAYFSSQRARRAELEAQQTRALAEQARGQAEQLLGYLTDDFVRELREFRAARGGGGILQAPDRLLPRACRATLKGPETIRNGALALVHHSRAMRTLGQLDVAGANADEAIKLLGGLRDGGDRSEATTVALAYAHAAKARVAENRADYVASAAANDRAVALLRPLMSGSQPSAAARRAYVVVASRIGWEQGAENRLEDSVRTEQEVMRVAAELGARDLRDLDMGAYYAEAGGWLATALAGLGRDEESRRASQDALAVADQVLERRPGDRLALHAEQVLTGTLVAAAENMMDPASGLSAADRQVQVSLTLLKLDPGNITSLNNLAVAEGQRADVLWGLGRLHESMPGRLRQLDAQRRATAGGATFIESYTGVLFGTVYAQAYLSDTQGAAATLASGAPVLAKLRQMEPPGSPTLAVANAAYGSSEAFAAYERDDLPAVRRATSENVHLLQGTGEQRGQLQWFKQVVGQLSYDLAGRTEFLEGDFAAAEQSESRAAVDRKGAGIGNSGDYRRYNEILTWLAMSQARQGHVQQAAQTIAPVIKYDRDLAARNHGDRWLPEELAVALYVQALTDSGKRTALLREALTMIDGVAPEIRATHDIRQWRARIVEAQHNRS